MKKTLLQTVKMISFYSFLGALLQVFLLNLLIAHPNRAQEVLSVKDVYVNVDIQNANLEEVFTILESKTNFRFSFDRRHLDRDLKLTLVGRNKSMEELLLQISREAALQFRQFNNDIDVKKSPDRFNLKPQIDIQIQDREITGKVVDENNEPLPGVNVLITGTSTGTVTDIEGDYSLTVPSVESVLVFSSVGYISEEVTVGDQVVINIAMMPDITALEEIVVVGYGTQKKSDVTGYVTSVPEERLSKIPVANVMQAVQGAVAGVTITQTSSIPGTSPDILVQGRNSITAGTGPYVVVDGIPISKMDGSINDISPNDIESIEILKDASATAIYGMNGSNGVILITTKRGKSNKPVIRYAGYTGVENIAHIPDMVSPEELLARYHEGNRINGSPMYNEDVKYEYEVENFNNGHTTDWIDAVSQTGVIQSHNLSISGGNTNISYYISGDVLDQKGVVKGYNYKRYSLRTNLEADVTDYLTIGTNTYVIAHNSDGGRANLLNAEAMSPYGTMYNEDGSYTYYPMYGETLWANPLLPTTTNPERRSYNVALNGFADLNFARLWKPLEGLKFRFNAGTTYRPRRESSYDGESVNNQLGSAEIWNAETRAYTIENILSYARDFGKHHFDLTGVYSSSQRRYNENTASASNFVNDELDWNRLQAGASARVASYADRYALISQMGRLNYSYNSRYLFTFTVRRDGSSVFADGKKYGVFPSVALGWNLANESFMASNEVVNNLKLRVSYGITGNEAVGVYRTFTTMGDVKIPFEGVSHIAMVTSGLGNNSLSWETTRKANIGVDFGFLNDRINGSFNIYSANTSDLLLSRQLPSTSGFSSVTANIGELKNNGVELTLNTRNIEAGDFKWNTTLVFSSNKNEIVELYGDGKDDLGNRWFIGEPVGVIYDYTKVGIWQEDEIANGDHLNWDPIAKPGDVKLADLSGPDGTPDGVIDNDDRTVLGQTSPKWLGGLTNVLSYKNLSLSIFIQTAQGQMRNNSHIGMASDELDRRNSLAEIGYWTPENKSNEWRSLNKNSNPHGYGFPVDASFTRIKDITLSYDFPEDLIRKIGIGSLGMYVSGRNLYTFTNWIGWDPEERDITRGSTNWDINYPAVRTVVFGLNITL